MDHPNPTPQKVTVDELAREIGENPMVVAVFVGKLCRTLNVPDWRLLGGMLELVRQLKAERSGQAEIIKAPASDSREWLAKLVEVAHGSRPSGAGALYLVGYVLAHCALPQERTDRIMIELEQAERAGGG